MPISFTRQVAPNPFLAEPWVLIASYLSFAGWLLSVAHQLNAIGYTIALVLGSILFWWLAPDFGRMRPRRFRRSFPLCFFVLALLAILGGALVPPSNYDGCAYRIPRILHWLAEDRWHWIHAEFSRLNTRPVGWEWMAAPLLAMTQSFRWLFLPNAISFLLFPGLVFSTFTRMGVRPRVAWFWMWLAPAGYCFLLQAGSIANDMVGAVFALAALDFALRAQKSRKLADVWFSFLSASLMTGCKSVNLPLLLPWAIAIFPVLPLLNKRIAATAAVAMLSVSASFLPMAALNQKYGDDWTGLAADQGRGGIQTEGNFRLLANAVLLIIQNFTPPLCPVVNAWNGVAHRVLPEKLTSWMERNLESGTACFQVDAMATEEGAGSGFGLSALLLLSLCAALLRQRKVDAASGIRPFLLYRFSLLLAPWLALLFLMNKSGASGVARFVTAYYCLLVPFLISGAAQAQIVRAKWWQAAALTTFAFAFLLLIISPARPLWPVLTVLGKMDLSNKPMLRQLYRTCAVKRARIEAFGPVRAVLPPKLGTIGFLSFDDPEASLWMPLGSLRVEHITATDTPSDLRRKGIEYVLANPENALPCLAQDYETWVARMGFEPVRIIPLALRGSKENTNWHLVKLPAER